MIACLKPQKDPLTFVDAADRASRKFLNSKFVLIGDGELADAVARRAKKMRYPENFLHVGWTRDVPTALASLDLMVLTSLWEGLPRVIPEATIAGVPTIASNIDGNREIIFEGRNGVLAEPRNVQDFAEKIVEALKDDWQVDPELSRQVQHDFDIREMVHQQEDLYIELSQAVTARSSRG
jgi:glycosyltransferase involved in cell wall biosynthesis